MTAKEMFENKFGYIDEESIELMIEFAKYHAELALISAAEEASVSMKEDMDYYYEDYVEGVNKASILNAYPLENIK